MIIDDYGYVQTVVFIAGFMFSTGNNLSNNLLASKQKKFCMEKKHISEACA